MGRRRGWNSKTGRDTCSRTDRGCSHSRRCHWLSAACAPDKGDLDESPRLDVGGQSRSIAVCFSQWFQIQVKERIHSSKYCASKILGLAKPGQKFGPTRTLGGAILQNTARGSRPTGSLSCVELGQPAGPVGRPWVPSPFGPGFPGGARIWEPPRSLQDRPVRSPGALRPAAPRSRENSASRLAVRGNARRGGRSERRRRPRADGAGEVR